VGLDVVRRNVNALSGAIQLESRKRQGTTFTIRLPLTLAIIDGFAVKVGTETYVIPLSSVQECLELPAEKAQFRGRRKSSICEAKLCRTCGSATCSNAVTPHRLGKKLLWWNTRWTRRSGRG